MKQKNCFSMSSINVLKLWQNEIKIQEKIIPDQLDLSMTLSTDNDDYLNKPEQNQHFVQCTLQFFFRSTLVSSTKLFIQKLCNQFSRTILQEEKIMLLDHIVEHRAAAID